MSRSGARTAVSRLRHRADFKRLSRGLRRTAADFVLQAGLSGSGEDRLGFTITRKVGSATERNRIRRRLRAAAAELESSGLPIDAVIVARRSCISRPFSELTADLAREWAESRRKLSNLSQKARPAG
jgi:ribonuclease P protein component